MPTWVWILIVVVVLAAAAVTIGLVLSRRRTVSLRSADEPAVDTKPTAGSYAAGGSISFSSSTPSSTSVLERTETDGQPGVGDDAAVPRDSVKPVIEDIALPEVPVFAPVDRPARPEPTVVVKPLEPAAGPDEIEPADGRLSKLRSRLARSQNTFGKSLLGLLGARDMDEDSWSDIEDTLLMADLGSGATAEIATKLRAEVAAHGVASAQEAKALLRKVMIDALDPSMDRAVKALPHDGRPSVVLVVGVNGTGKTTTTGKLARVLVAQGHSVVLGAADTFRAAAADQLATWGERAGAQTVRGAAGSDPLQSRSRR